MIDNPTRVDETIEEEATGVMLSPEGRRGLLPVDMLEAYDLHETVVDMIVSQGETAARMPDTEIDSQGRFRVPDKLATLYGIEAGKPVTVFIPEVVMR